MGGPKCFRQCGCAPRHAVSRHRVLGGLPRLPQDNANIVVLVGTPARARQGPAGPTTSEDRRTASPPLLLTAPQLRGRGRVVQAAERSCCTYPPPSPLSPAAPEVSRGAW